MLKKWDNLPADLQKEDVRKYYEILETSENRTETDCETYKRCGGCKLQHSIYKSQLDFKYNRVKDCIEKIEYNREKPVRLKKEKGVKKGEQFAVGGKWTNPDIELAVTLRV